MVATSFSDLLSQLDFWRGVGKLVVELCLIAAMFVLVMAYSGNRLRWRPRPTPPGSGHPAAEETSGGTEGETEQLDEEKAGSGGGSGSDPNRVAHQNLLASLRTSLRYQGSTVALIVFAVLILGVAHVIAGPEAATILSGITGYVLGSSRPNQPQAGPSSSTPPAGTS